MRHPPHPHPRPRIPETHQRTRLARDRNIRQIVFGAQDGLLTALGIVTGVGAGLGDRSVILLTGFVALVVGALSMGVGEFLGGRTEREVLENALELEKSEMAEFPEDEFAEQVSYYRTKGFPRDEAEMIVRRLQQHPEIWLHEMMRDEFGIDPRDIEEDGLRPAVIMGTSFAAGAIVPLLGFLLPVRAAHAQIVSACLAAFALFSIGFAAGRLGGRSPVRKGIEIVAAGALVFAISHAVGHLVPWFFGHDPISSGG